MTYPLPFLGLLVLLASAAWWPLNSEQWVVIAVWVLYLMPYMVVSYYDRYRFPLLGLDAVLIAWAMTRIGWLWETLRTPVGALEENA